VLWLCGNPRLGPCMGPMFFFRHRMGFPLVSIDWGPINYFAQLDGYGA